MHAHPFRPLKVHICHGEPIIKAGLAALLAGNPDIELCDSAQNRLPADVVVTDYRDGIERMEQADMRGERVMIVTQRSREWDVRAAMSAGVHGYLSQQCPSSELAEALHALGRGQRYFNKELLARAVEHFLGSEFTLRESQVLELLAQGCSNKLIARHLGIGVGTVKTHVKSLFNKLGATARTHAVVLATQRGIVNCHAAV